MATLVAACSNGPASQRCGRAPERTPRSLDLAAVGATALDQDVWRFESAEETFSSPRATDLDGDGVLDIVLGFGQDTFGARGSSVVALSGANGTALWRSSGHEDLVGSATFVEIDGDDVSDVVIGGRRGALIAVSGATGELLWEFDDQNGRWFNFYTSQSVADQNGDGVRDLLATNGGLVIDEPEEGQGLPATENKRVVGRVFIVSGANGEVIESVPVPDGQETYMSAVVTRAENGEPEIVFGTGGETQPGSLWRTSLESIASRSLDSAVRIFDGREKGLIAAPSIASFGVDCRDHLAVQAFDGTLAMIDATTGTTRWTVANPGFETYSSPTLGWFVGDDDVPDVFSAAARGVWPEYEHSEYLLVDGASGEVVWRTALGTFAPSGFVAVDVDGDGADEILFGVNDVSSNTHQLHLLDPGADGLLIELGDPGEQTSFSSPWIGDLDDDGRLDLITVVSSYQQDGSTVVRRYVLPFDTPATISWGAYLGSGGDGRLLGSDQ